MKKYTFLLFTLVIFACGDDSEEPEVIIEKPNVKTSITQTESSSCPLGGYDILVFDDANSNGIQDAAEELFLESTVCFEENRNITTKVSNLESDECEFGGLLISVYDDANSNSSIDQTEEVFHEIVECFPRDANVQTYIVDADLETCPVGGKSITVYDDVNDNQIPDEGEQIFYAGSECYPEQDFDMDGIFDDNDLCPDTDPGLEVDENGCALNQKDTDSDGVTDDLDLCPNTPTGAAVNETGCAAEELDTDQDGVTNDLDFCPNTPIGEVVNENGCGLNEQDSIYIDPSNGITVKCPNANVGDVAVLNGKTYTVVGNLAQTLAIIDDLDNSTCACTSKITNMNSWFYGRSTLEDITDWDTSNVTSMASMFQFSGFNQDISKWDVSNVISMPFMFLGSGFNQDISAWDVGNVIDMNTMFSNSSFNQNLDSWDVSNVIQMRFMFAGSQFNGEIGSWNVESVNDMSYMFYRSPFNQPIGGWNTVSVGSMGAMFSGSDFNQDLSQWNVISVINMSEMFLDSFYNQDLSSWDVSNVTSCTDFSSNTPNWILPKPNFTNCIP